MVDENAPPPTALIMRLACLRILPVLGMILSMGCSDQLTAPEAVASAGAPSLKIIPTYAPDRKSADIMVEPSGGVFVLGRHAIYFPKNSICDPATSTYGVTEWDAPCDAITRPIRIRVVLVEQADRSWLDFSPALRFVPSNRPDEWVYLFMATDKDWKRGKNDKRDFEPEHKAKQNESRPPILWSPAIGIPGIDESLTDPTQTTQWSSQFNGVHRRIKHFSGYNVHQGYKRKR